MSRHRHLPLQRRRRHRREAVERRLPRSAPADGGQPKGKGKGKSKSKDKAKGKGKNVSSPYPSYSGGWTWTAATAWSGTRGAWGQPTCPVTPPADDSWVFMIVLLLILLGIIVGIAGTFLYLRYCPLQRNWRDTYWFCIPCAETQTDESFLFRRLYPPGGVGVQTTEEQWSDFNPDQSWSSESESEVEETPDSALAAGSNDRPAVPAPAPAPAPAVQVPVEQPRGNAAASSSTDPGTAPAVDPTPPPPPGGYPCGHDPHRYTARELREQGIGEGVCFHRSTCGMVIQRLNTRPWDVAYRSVQQCLDTGYRPCRDFGT